MNQALRSKLAYKIIVTQIWIYWNGSTIRLGNNPWVLACLNHTPRLNPAYQLLANEKVNTLTYRQKEGWNKNKIKSHFHLEDATAILQFPPPSKDGRDDLLLWTSARRGNSLSNRQYTISTELNTQTTQPKLPTKKYGGNAHRTQTTLSWLEALLQPPPHWRQPRQKTYRFNIPLPSMPTP